MGGEVCQLKWKADIITFPFLSITKQQQCSLIIMILATICHLYLKLESIHQEPENPPMSKQPLYSIWCSNDKGKHEAEKNQESGIKNKYQSQKSRPWIKYRNWPHLVSLQDLSALTLDPQLPWRPENRMEQLKRDASQKSIYRLWCQYHPCWKKSKTILRLIIQKSNIENQTVLSIEYILSCSRLQCIYWFNINNDKMQQNIRYSALGW